MGGDRREGEVRGLCGDDTDDGHQTGGAEKERYGCSAVKVEVEGGVAKDLFVVENKTEPVCSSRLYQSHDSLFTKFCNKKSVSKSVKHMNISKRQH